jgi:hypothetical protein
MRYRIYSKEAFSNSDSSGELRCKLCDREPTNRWKWKSERTANLIFPGASDASREQTLEKDAQIRCHLLCARTQLSELRFRRIPFHLFGILRAIRS